MTRLHPTLAHHLTSTLGWPDLRPLQARALSPIGAGDDALLIAPTAGGKTEAALFPLLTRMADDGRQGLSVLYLCPLKALLNNLHPRLERYAGWLGRTVGLWHGDIPDSRRRAMLHEPPDILLTTPESLEAMLISARVDHRRLMADLRAVVVDEVHAFARDDRGWHLLAVLERLARLAGRPLQRIGLSATVGDPPALLRWLQGTATGRPGMVVAPPDGADGAGDADVELDHVGTLANAAKIIAGLHGGEKRLVFCDSRRAVEELGELLRAAGVTAFLSHASLAAAERRRAEEAFAEARDCVIVSTSTLELGIDVGDLDRVVQINAPRTAASFLQRLGRTGRRPGKRRNCLLLALTRDDLLAAAGLLHLWGTGYVEPVRPPAEPRHIAAQQLLALALQEGHLGTVRWREWWRDLEVMRDAGPILDHLRDRRLLTADGGRLMIGDAAEQSLGRRHFMELTSVFTAPPEFTVLQGDTEIGRVGPQVLLSAAPPGGRLLLLAGRTWRVDWTDWKRRRCFVDPVDGTGGEARWSSASLDDVAFEATQAVRDVLLGADPPVRLTRRATAALAAARADAAGTVDARASVIERRGGDVHWWTWAGRKGNATLRATLGPLADPAGPADGRRVRLRADLTPAAWAAGAARARTRIVAPRPEPQALTGLKFSAALPPALAERTLAARLTDADAAARLLARPVTFLVR
ncbi:DEAD/DEAH box helicase [Actinomadura parmotrematis]|uniref:DEAD/DEAH box helicase n=1 Tax=Actinomadura parmotrematis TaxID=2864039 RepID=A0ABS7G1J6_9ACTN|nr:DEAD/DEAH box helicase [Actinomadura parmotrematis]MBW8485528.1 DEAD/DEAH box helicase [Actinomadura parmotrematis]